MTFQKNKKTTTTREKQKLDLFYSPTIRYMVLREAVKGFYKFYYLPGPLPWVWPRPRWSTLRKWRIPRWSAKTHGGLGWGSSWRTSPRHYQGTGGSIAKPIRIHIRRPRVEEIKIEMKVQRRPKIEEEMFTWYSWWLLISAGVVNYRTGKRNQTW